MHKTKKQINCSKLTVSFCVNMGSMSIPEFGRKIRRALGCRQQSLSKSSIPPRCLAAMPETL